MKWWLWASAILGIFIIIGYLSISYVARSPPVSCDVLAQGTAGSTGIVFFGTAEQAREYRHALLSFVPFNESPEAFTWYVSDFQPVCEFYRDVALFCYSKDIVQAVHTCGAQYGIVVREADSAIRSSAFEGIMSINARHSLSVFAHEFGHAFAGFDEEYAPASLSGGAGNCEATCQTFGVSDGCYRGCSDTGYYRSIEAGIMRTLTASRYGTWHESYLRTKLAGSGVASSNTLALAPLDCSTQTYSLLTLTRSATGDLTVNDVARGQGCGEQTPLIDGARFVVFSDVQEMGSVTLSGEQYSYEGTVYAAVADDVSTLILVNGNQTQEVHLGTTLCKQ